MCKHGGGMKRLRRRWMRRSQSLRHGVGQRAVLKEYVVAKKIAKKAMGEKEIRRKAQHRRRAEICVQNSKADGKGKAGYSWSELPEG